ncbi:MAG: hypothetical protein ACRENB_07355 [Gemmatimonadales bacterium]
MRRAVLGLAALAALSACRPYDNYSPIASQDGLIPPDQFARYGREQAQLVAIGRSLAAWRMSDMSRAAAEVARYAGERLPDVVSVVPDPQGYRLTVTFRSGWRTAAVPIDDGVHPDSTVGLPRAQ